MSRLVHLLRCVGRAVVKNGGKALASLFPFGEVTFEIARDVVDEYRKTHGEALLRGELQALAQAAPDEARQAARDAAALEAAEQPESVQLALVSYLDQLPLTIRQTLRRPGD